MLRWLPLLVLALPFAELWLLLKMAERTSGTSTFLWVIGSAVLGGWMARWQLARNAERLQAAAERGELLGGAIAENTLILAGGFLLVLPGLITDTLGALLLVPPVRHFIGSQLARGARFEVHSYTRHEGGPWRGPGPRPRFGEDTEWLQENDGDPNVIDSYVVRRTESLPKHPPEDP